jgi:WD40 repeat protein
MRALGNNNWSVALSPDGRWLAVGDVAGNIKIWDWPARCAGTNLAFPSRAILALAFASGGRFLWAGVQHPEVLARTGRPARAMKVWRTDTWEEVQLNANETKGMRWADFSPDNCLLAMAQEDGTVRLWSFPDGEPVGPPLTGHSPQVERVLFSPNGRTLASAGFDDFVKLWDVHDRRELMTLRSHFNHLTTLAFSPDGRRLAVTGSSPGTAIKLWDPATQRELITLQIDTRADRPSFLTTFSPDGNTLASAPPYGPVHLWRAPSWAEIEAVEQGRVAP